MHAITLDYTADDLPMLSDLYLPPGAAGGGCPAVLLFPEAWGIGEHVRMRAERLAHEGYVALACDLHGEGRRHDSLEQVMELIAPLRADVSRIRARTVAALQALNARPEVDTQRVAAIGYCFGGTMALELARSGAAIRATIGFHCGLATPVPDDAARIRGSVLVCIGADDPAIPASERAAFEDEMRAASVDWQLHLYGGVVHGFTNRAAAALGRPDFARFDAAADARSWRAMREALTAAGITP
ncbi:MAG: hypothetical protein CALGDGBN_00092 [Pseudomonadales bacterium]|nr:hypothetical protein [Pseudomonadales bacterium]